MLVKRSTYSLHADVDYHPHGTYDDAITLLYLKYGRKQLILQEQTRWFSISTHPSFVSKRRRHKEPSSNISVQHNLVTTFIFGAKCSLTMKLAQIIAYISNSLRHNEQ